MRKSLVGILFLFLFISPKLSTAQDFTLPNRIINYLKDSAFLSAFNSCSPEYKTQIKDISSFIHIWVDITSKLGTYKSHYFTDYQYDSIEKTNYYEARLQFQFLSHIVQLQFNARKELTFIGFHSAYTFYTPPLSVDISKIKTISLHVGYDSLPLKANLVIPNQSQKAPLAIIINEAGPTSRDFDYEPNLPYKDLALLLGMHGVAVLRYDKRTVEHQFMFVSNAYNHVRYTPEEEYIQDFDKILQQMKARTDIDTSRIYLIGHGQGGYLSPYLAKHFNGIKGMVFLATNAKNTLQMMVEQFDYLMHSTPEKKAFYNEQKRHALFAMQANLSETTPVDSLPYYVPAEYWNWLNAYDAVEVTKSLNIPVFVAQFGRDYQTNESNYKVWKKALRKLKNKKFVLYPKLNHIGLEGSNTQTTYSEYYIKGNIPDYVAKDISEWILSFQLLGK